MIKFVKKVLSFRRARSTSYGPNAWVIIAKSSAKSSISCIFRTFQPPRLIMQAVNYVNRANYANCFFCRKSYKPSDCTYPFDKIPIFPSARHFFRIVNYGNRFVTIFLGDENVSIPFFSAKPHTVAEFLSNAIDKARKLCYILFVKSYDEGHAFPERAPERNPFGARIPAPCPK